MDLPGYDEWKLATPPEYEGPECRICGEPIRRSAEDHLCDGCWVQKGCGACPLGRDSLGHCCEGPDWEPTETQQGLIPIPDGYAEQ